MAWMVYPDGHWSVADVPFATWSMHPVVEPVPTHAPLVQACPAEHVAPE
jgi:hypothetical protein